MSSAKNAAAVDSVREYLSLLRQPNAIVTALIRVAVKVDGDHLARPPVREPQTILVPAWLLAKRDPRQQDAQLRR